MKTASMIRNSDHDFLTRVKESEQDKFAQKAIASAQDAQWVKREGARQELGNWEDWRNLGEQIRQHVVRYLPDYLEEFSDNVEKNGGHVFFAQTDVEARDFIVELAKKKQAKHVMKSKSMVTTEIGIDKALLEIPGLDLLETDLAEFILQEDDWDEPTHLVFPAIHKNRDQVREVFIKKLGYEGDNDPQHLARFARKVLRERFLKNDFCITGCNFAIADNGWINLDTNEGNADLCMAIPKTQVVVMGMERLVPTLKEAETMDNMLARSAVGQKITTYCTFTNRKTADETDGPEDFYVVILDNGRSNALGTDFEPILQCIRCASCLNVCPIYRHIGGHGYGSIYPGPVGSVLSPVLEGNYDDFADLPYACSVCAACSATCPVKIPLHKLLVKHREIMMDDLHQSQLIEDAVMRVVGLGTGHPSLFRPALGVAHTGTSVIAKKNPQNVKNLYEDGKHLSWMPFVFGGWTKERDFPDPPAHKDGFRKWYKTHKPVEADPKVAAHTAQRQQEIKAEKAKRGEAQHD
ncbi:iron-sulfur cluster-binding protein [Bombiscardovia apis]|uniref:Iron-sulfur cluster-binding protein n=1 Tax=Bombiscardovia apis TaxID=2932182 RepID=A0ABN6SDP7_9BIFI|nr:LutB/LldF family L-lactate oxidation iron-sulfur protein [Bombiscardovia apis]BDR54184.1 iron-sulfur cluster-binding protein [Bombiscardovia apis]